MPPSTTSPGLRKYRPCRAGCAAPRSHQGRRPSPPRPPRGASRPARRRSAAAWRNADAPAPREARQHRARPWHRRPELSRLELWSLELGSLELGSLGLRSLELESLALESLTTS